MRKLFTKPTPSRNVAVALLAVLIYGAGLWYWVMHITDNLAGRFQ